MEYFVPRRTAGIHGEPHREISGAPHPVFPGGERGFQHIDMINIRKIHLPGLHEERVVRKRDRTPGDRDQLVGIQDRRITGRFGCADGPGFCVPAVPRVERMFPAIRKMWTTTAADYQAGTGNDPDQAVGH